MMKPVGGLLHGHHRDVHHRGVHALHDLGERPRRATVANRDTTATSGHESQGA
jgi:hypothetical protein